MTELNPISLEINPFQAGDQVNIRLILERIGWAEGYIAAFEAAASAFASSDHSAVYVAKQGDHSIGFIFVECHLWNHLAQLQGLAVDPGLQRSGVATALVAEAEDFARKHQMRGIYVDTPVDNAGGRRFYEAIGYQLGYIMPRYYEDHLDGVTYQKFFD